jgi:hypothetical protein
MKGKLSREALGVTLLSFGLAFVLYFWLIYDVTVSEVPYAAPETQEHYGRVVNEKKLSDRNAGLGAGAVLTIAGAIILAARGRSQAS